MISRDAKSLISNIEIKDERVAKSLILHLMKSLISDAKSLISKMKINDFKTVKIIDSESESIDFREKNRWFHSDRSRHDASFWDVPHLAHARRCWGADRHRSVPSRGPASSPSPHGRNCRATPEKQAHSNKFIRHRLYHADAFMPKKKVTRMWPLGTCTKNSRPSGSQPPGYSQRLVSSSTARSPTTG